MADSSAAAASKGWARLGLSDLYNLLQDSAVNKGIFDIRLDGTAYSDWCVKTSLHVALDLPESIEVHEEEPEEQKRTTSSAILTAARVRRFLWDSVDEKAAVEDAPARNAWTQRGLFPANLVVLIGGGSSRSTTNNSLASGFARLEAVAELLAVEGKAKRDRIFLVEEGVDQFRATYPMCCSSADRNVQALPGLLPSEVVPGFLFLGSHENAKSWDIIKGLGITHVLNMAGELENPFPDTQVQYLKLGIDDKSAEDVAQHFDEALAFMYAARDASLGLHPCEHAIQGRSRVLVHCAMGISRSSAITIAYLMQTRALLYDEAHEYVRMRRSCIKPNPGFVAQLRNYEAAIKACSEQKF